jgi:hypothetical protein
LSSMGSGIAALTAIFKFKKTGFGGCPPIGAWG